MLVQDYHFALLPAADPARKAWATILTFWHPGRIWSRSGYVRGTGGTGGLVGQHHCRIPRYHQNGIETVERNLEAISCGHRNHKQANNSDRELSVSIAWPSDEERTA